MGERKIVLDRPYDKANEQYVIREEDGGINLEIDKIFYRIIDGHFLLVRADGNKSLGIVDRANIEEMKKRLYLEARKTAMEFLELYNEGILNGSRRFIFEDRTDVRKNLL